MSAILGLAVHEFLTSAFDILTEDDVEDIQPLEECDAFGFFRPPT